MNGHDEIIYDISQSTYCVGTSKNKNRIYLDFFETIIEKYLSDPQNYYIYVSTYVELITLYQTKWINHDRLIYITDDLVPSSIPANVNSIYFYHQKNKPTKEEQINLLNYVKSHPQMKYIYIGDISNLLPVIYYSLFAYYLHFANSPYKRYRTQPILKHGASRSINSRYRLQRQRMKKSLSPIFIYDYCLLHCFLMDETVVTKFNEKKYVPKKKKIPVKANKPNLYQKVPTYADIDTDMLTIENKFKMFISLGNSLNSQISSKIQKNSNEVPKNPNYLIMPDGSKENFVKISNEYQNVIDI